MPSKSNRPVLPPLPQHPSRGVTVHAGDKVEPQDIQLSLKFPNKVKVDASPITMAVPGWASAYKSGATFRLKHVMAPTNIKLANAAICIPPSGRYIEVALDEATVDPLYEAHNVAERILDILAAEWFRIAELDDPLREYSIWYRTEGHTVLRCASTLPWAVEMTPLRIVVTAPDGTVRIQEKPNYQWHASHAYFRQSQTADKLHEAYRNLYLALEAVLSEVYPRQKGIGERAWMEAALEHVVTGYGLDLTENLGTGAGNPYKRFIREQYKAFRCALFHAKLSQGPILPGDTSNRQELVDATRRLGQLYLVIARRITGSGFAEGWAASPFFAEAIMSEMNGADFYVCENQKLDMANVQKTLVELTPHALGKPGLHHLTGSWSGESLPETIRRIGVLRVVDGEQTEMMTSDIDINTTGVNVLEHVLQLELVNTRNLRDWFFMY